MNEYCQAWQLGLTFGGRASRRSYWMFFSINAAISVALVILEVYAGSPPWVEIGYSLVSLLPFLAVTVRRLHDTGHSAWWLCAGFIPLAGIAVLLVLLARRSDPGINRFGLA